MNMESERTKSVTLLGIEQLQTLATFVSQWLSDAWHQFWTSSWGLHKLTKKLAPKDVLFQ
jgi:hypothetical protein